MRVLHRSQSVWTTMVLLSSVLLHLAMTSEVKANILYQTVPTMPPPTKSPTVTPPTTPVSPPENTPTYVQQPSATYVQVTPLPPTQTAVAAATQTEVSLQNSPTASIEGVAGSPSPVPGTATTQSTGTMTVNPPVPPQVSAEQENKKTEGLSLIGVVIGVVLLIAATIWFWRLETRSK